MELVVNKSVSEEKKHCEECRAFKVLSDFYFYKNSPRKDCKKCIIKRNGDRQKYTKSWRKRHISRGDTTYSREYYKKNKEKFASYRQKFMENNPDYYKNYYLNAKFSKSEPEKDVA